MQKILIGLVVLINSLCFAAADKIVCNANIDLIGGELKDYRYEITERGDLYNYQGVEYELTDIDTFSKPFSDFVQGPSHMALKEVLENGDIKYTSGITGDSSTGLKGHLSIIISDDLKNSRLILTDKEYPIDCYLE